MESGQSKWTDNIHKQVSRLNGLIGNLISLTKLEELNSLEVLDFSLSDIVEESTNEVKDLALSLDKNILVDVEKDISFKGDEKLIIQLVNILLDNAIKYAREKTDIKVKRSRQNRKITLKMCIRDRSWIWWNV